MGLWERITDKNWKTWVGHALLGLFIFFLVAGLGAITTGVNWAVCAASTTAYFFGREITNIEPYIGAYLKDGTKVPTEKIIDGFFDFWTPMFVSIALALVLNNI